MLCNMEHSCRWFKQLRNQAGAQKWWKEILYQLSERYLFVRETNDFFFPMKCFLLSRVVPSIQSLHRSVYLQSLRRGVRVDLAAQAFMDSKAISRRLPDDFSPPITTSLLLQNNSKESVLNSDSRKQAKNGKMGHASTISVLPSKQSKWRPDYLRIRESARSMR